MVLQSCKRLLHAATRYQKAKGTIFAPHQYERDKLLESHGHLKRYLKEKFVPVYKIKSDQIFAVNQTNFNRINIYGFDYDYTLAEYSTDLQEFIYRKAMEILHKKYSYPKGLSDMAYIPDFCIRGLHYDVERGLFMKIDERHIVQLDTVHRGLQPLKSDAAIQELGYVHIPKKDMDASCYRGNSQLQQLTDIFSLPEMLLLANTIEHFTLKNMEYHPSSIFRDVQKAVSDVHTEGHLFNEVRSNTEKYLEKDCLTKLINKLHDDGKKVFLLTNSSLPFVRIGLEHMLGKDWQDAFDVIIVKARKPEFFDVVNKPFKTVSSNGSGHSSWDRIQELKKGDVYTGGCCSELMRICQWKSGEVMYFGDQIYADLQTPRHTNGWYTCAVIKELEREIDVMNDVSFAHNVVWIQTLERLIERMQDYGDAESQQVVAEWLEERRATQRLLKYIFNPRFGSIFRCALQGSYFSARLCRVADVYTSSVMNLLNYHRDKILFPPRGSHPHEQLVSTAYQYDGFDTAVLDLQRRMNDLVAYHSLL